VHINWGVTPFICAYEYICASTYWGVTPFICAPTYVYINMSQQLFTYWGVTQFRRDPVTTTVYILGRDPVYLCSNLCVHQHVTTTVYCAQLYCTDVRHICAPTYVYINMSQQLFTYWGVTPFMCAATYVYINMSQQLFTVHNYQIVVCTTLSVD